VRQRRGLLARFRPGEIGLEQPYHRLGHLAIGGLDGFAAARGIRWEPDQRARAVHVVEMLARQIGIDDVARKRLTPYASLRGLLLPRLRRPAQEWLITSE
jgi:hypothetical protein